MEQTSSEFHLVTIAVHDCRDVVGQMAVAERSRPFSPPVERRMVGAMSSLPTSLLRAARTPFSAARRSLFITISLPPHLFDITYSVWKYCPFCPRLHHLLTQSCVCVWVGSSWHTQEVNTFTSPEIADSGRGGGGTHTLRSPTPR